MKIKIEKETIQPKYKVGDLVVPVHSINDPKHSEVVRYMEIAEVFVQICYNTYQVFYDVMVFELVIERGSYKSNEGRIRAATIPAHKDHHSKQRLAEPVIKLFDLKGFEKKLDKLVSNRSS